MPIGLFSYLEILKKVNYDIPDLQKGMFINRRAVIPQASQGKDKSGERI